MLTYVQRYRGAVALSGVLAACGADEGRSDPSAGVRMAVVEGARIDPSVQSDFERLAEDLGDLQRSLGLDGVADAELVVTYLGRGQVIEEGEEATPDRRVLPEPEERADIAYWDAVSLRSGNEFRVALPTLVLDEAEARGRLEGLDRGSEPVELGTEASEWTRPELEPESPQEPLTLPDGTPVAAGLSNAQDTRTLRGTLDVAQTYSAYRKLVDIGGCSGTLIGPKHIVTAAHCIRDGENSAWMSRTARAGRSRNAWRDSVNFSTSDAWYWTPSQYRSLADGLEKMPFSATPYDIGVIVTHGDRMGDTVGWMGWAWWWTDGDFANRARYNRGYPICGRANSPANCQTNGLYGDTAWCSSGSYSSPDADGINRSFRFHCDISGGHSGSSMYTYLGGTTLAVTSIVSWEHCLTCGANDDRPNTGVRITKSYAGTISAFRQAFP